MVYIRTHLLTVLTFTLALFGAAVALVQSDIPSACHSQCDKVVSLLNSCGLETDASNANDDNRKCFCGSSSSAGYNSCRDCVQEHTKDDGDRKRNLGERDLLAGLLDIDSIVCTAAKVVNDVTSVAVSLATSVLDDATSILLPTTTHHTSSGDTITYYSGTSTVTTTKTVSASSTSTSGAGVRTMAIPVSFATAIILVMIGCSF